MPFCVVGAFLTQAASSGPVLLRQNSQIGDVAVIESHPFLHVGCESERIWGTSADSYMFFFFSQHLRNTVRLGGLQLTPVTPSTLATLMFAGGVVGERRGGDKMHAKAAQIPRCNHTTDSTPRRLPPELNRS